MPEILAKRIPNYITIGLFVTTHVRTDVDIILDIEKKNNQKIYIQKVKRRLQKSIIILILITIVQSNIIQKHILGIN